MDSLAEIYRLEGKVAAITGATGVIPREISKAFAKAGAKIAVLNRTESKGAALVAEIQADGGVAAYFQCDVLEKNSLVLSASAIMDTFGQVDILVNGAGGNISSATTDDRKPFFDLPLDAMEAVIHLNLTSLILSSQIFSKLMVKSGEGAILNISSMNSYRPLTRIPAYSAAKAGVSNFTQWLAVHLAQEYSPLIRVNAIAPGFFLTEQNHFLLIDEDHGNLTERGQAIIAHTPMGRFGMPDDLIGTAIWLVSPASRFVTGIVVPVDGGFSAFSGV